MGAWTKPSICMTASSAPILMTRRFARSLHEAGRLSAATGSYRDALAIDGDLAAAWINLRQALTDQGDLPGAVDSLACAEALVEKGQAGRDDIDDAIRRARHAATPPTGGDNLARWRGEALAGHRLLIFSNHGVGDGGRRGRPDTAMRPGRAALGPRPRTAWGRGSAGRRNSLFDRGPGTHRGVAPSLDRRRAGGRPRMGGQPGQRPGPRPLHPVRPSRRPVQMPGRLLLRSADRPAR
jgi:hypothetical protein